MRFLHAGTFIGALACALQAPTAVAAHAVPYAAATGVRAYLARVAAARRSQTATVSHFDEPYGVATDQYGNLFVANVEGKNNVVEVYSSLVVRGNVPGTATPAAISIAVDNEDDVYVGSEYGYVNDFSPSGSLNAKITANVGFPSSIAVDQFQDVFIAPGAGFAVDDSVGRSIFSDLLPTLSVESLAFGGPYLFVFADGKRYFGDGSYVLRLGEFSAETGLAASAPVGAACANDGTCWISDSSDDHLMLNPIFGSPTSIKLTYLPAGVAYDAAHDRLFVADPAHNAVQLYTASTLKFVQTIR